LTSITGLYEDKGSLYNTSNVTASGDYVSGGFASVTQDMTTQSNATNTGTILDDYATAGETYVAGLVGFAGDSVTFGGEVSNTGDVTAKANDDSAYLDYVGGIAGYVTDTLTQAFTGTVGTGLSNKADIVGGEYVGGIAGRVGAVEVTNMVNAPNVNGVIGNTNYVAGIIGMIDNTLTVTGETTVDADTYAVHNTSNIETDQGNNVSGGFGHIGSTISMYGNMFNSGSVTTEKTDAQYMAGLIAYTTGAFANSTRQINIVNNGMIGEADKLYTTYAGGIVGYTNQPITQNSETYSIDMLNTADVYGKTFIGGAIGENNTLTMGSIINTGSAVTGIDGYVAGLVANSLGSVTLTNNVAVDGEAEHFEMYNKANVTNTEGDYISGGIAKITGSLTFKGNLYNSGDVTSTNDKSSYVGGIAGYVSTDVVSNPNATIFAKNEGDILASGTDNKSYVAGVIGLVDGMVDCDTYTDFANTSNIYGTDYVAGIIGKVGASLSARTLSNIGPDTVVTASSNYVAGLVGFAGTSVAIDNANANGVSMENVADVTTNSNYVSGGIAYIGDVTTITKGAINSGN
ncbi:MAG: hypothetical protein IJW28_00195, partial [Clostridia bacterium]|nr:hypothetical protein [Clostridia bacterium]